MSARFIFSELPFFNKELWLTRVLIGCFYLDAVKVSRNFDQLFPAMRGAKVARPVSAILNYHVSYILFPFIPRKLNKKCFQITPQFTEIKLEHIGILPW